MPTIAISDAALRSLKPAEKHVDFWDEKLPAFGVRVAPSGSKTFIINQHRARQSLGQYPIISLSEARSEAKRRMAEKTLGKVRPQSITYLAAVQLFIADRQKQCRPRTVADYIRHLKLLGFKCPLADVSLDDLERKLKRLTPGEYNHRLVAAKTFFKWALKRRYIEHDPAISLTKHTPNKRTRILTDEELKAVWTAAGQCGQFGVIVRLLIATGQRRGEIAALQPSWISDNQITLPATITKNGREHTFPMTALNADILNSAIKAISNTSKTTLLFPARGNSSKPFNGWSKSKAALDKLCPIPPWTLHDLRRTYRSTLPRLGVAPHIAERLVNHISARTQMEQTYDHFAYWDEMVAAVQKHDDWLSSLLGR